MEISSPTFEHNTLMPSKYTCDGADINPPLKISGVPEDTACLALVMDDPDAQNKTWLHWTAWNIKPQTCTIEEDSVPANAVEGKTSFGVTGYGGPCPPSGTHRYFFKLYALDCMLDLKQGAGLRELEKAMEGHIIGKTEFIGLYKKK